MLKRRPCDYETASEGPQVALNVSASKASFRQLSGAFPKTYARREFFSP